MVRLRFKTPSLDVSGQALPNIMPANQLFSYCIRVTTNYDGMKRLVKSSECASRYLITKEISKKDKEHYHATFIDVPLDIDDFRALFKRDFPDLNSGHLYNIQKADNLDKAIAYPLKDLDVDLHKEQIMGNLIFKGFTFDQLDKYKRFSYKKYNGKTIMSDIEALELQFHADQTIRRKEDCAKYLNRLISIKTSYNQPANWRRSIDLIELWSHKRFPEWQETSSTNRWEKHCLYD